MRTLVGVAVVVLCGLAPAAARAGNDKAAVKKFAQAQARALMDVDTLAATFTDDAFLVYADGYAMGAEDVRGALGGMFSDAHDEITGVKLKSLAIGLLDGAAWWSGDLVVSSVGHGGEGESVEYEPVTYRLTELVVKRGSTWKTRAAHLSVAVSDKDAKADQTKPDAVPPSDDDGGLGETLASATALADVLADDKATIVIGSSPKERAVGRAKARKLLKKWSKLAFEVVGGVHWEVEAERWGFAVANVALGDVTYRVLAILAPDPGGWQVVSLHYSVQP